MDEALDRAIRDAFAGTTQPPRPLTGHRCLECDRVDAELGGRSWHDVAGEFPPYCYDAFPLLTSAARAYFLPAYLLVALRPASGLAGTSLESALGSSEWLDPAWFAPAQRAAVVLWAAAYWPEWCGEGPPAELVAQWRPAGMCRADAEPGAAADRGRM